MNDLQIRKAFHRTFLRTHHRDPSTLVLDELGLQHGKSRADIAVINGDLSGFEIKSDVDSLQRLTRQIERYSAVFDLHSLWLIVTSTTHQVCSPTGGGSYRSPRLPAAKSDSVH